MTRRRFVIQALGGTASLLLIACGQSTGGPAAAPAKTDSGSSKPGAAEAPKPTTAPASQPAAKTDAKPAEAAKPAQQAPAAKASGPLVFFSSQFKPIEEQEKMRQVVLKDAPVPVDYIPEDPGPFNDRLTAEQKAGRVTISLLGGLHGDFAPFVQADQLEDLTPLVNGLTD